MSVEHGHAPVGAVTVQDDGDIGHCEKGLGSSQYSNWFGPEWTLVSYLALLAQMLAENLSSRLNCLEG